MSELSHRWFSRIADIDSALWQTFFSDDPLTSHAFLWALEHSGCVSQATGWQPMHLAIYQDQQLVALSPGYLKSHSYGEYVFDWAWAEAYQQHGLEYYPKWLSAVPFSPVEGHRISIKHSEPARVYQYIEQLLQDTAKQQGWSGWHVNFCSEQVAKQLAKGSAMLRLGVQFQWFNQDHHCFNDFLHSMSARKRKAIKKERAKISAANITIQWYQGEQITPAQMNLFIAFYQRTYLKRSGHLGYLNSQFFTLLQQLMADQLVLMFAKQNNQVIAATFSLKSHNTLYGRYWGASHDIDCLHFELCYYQGIEFCIANNLKHFHCGAQGEHKISRGFSPVYTYSAHAMIDTTFAAAIADYLQREQQHMAIYKQQCQALLPFKQ
ncbi:GNAT family N-acetyltransferase [Pseudoalteromonas mariniglutinosa]|uniref:GNAT family N-acetyltransferase n=1 Tax=Pseudoalteromonas mariniglutinosa TaxID=206042 RepID=UPI00384A87E4